MFSCQFPECTYKTEHRHMIHYHHLKPKEAGGPDIDWNRTWLCPNHHSLVYCPESTSGIHTKQTKESIILIGWMQSTDGKVLCWARADDPTKELFHFMENT